MVVFLNGHFVAKAEAVVSVFDRSFLYGDGLFESVRILNGRPFRWQNHMERLQRGAEFLKLTLPFEASLLRDSLERLVESNGLPSALLRISLSRGVGLRGYSPVGAGNPTLVMFLHPLPPLEAESPLEWRLALASFRLPAAQPLAQFKTCNKLAQILARAEAEGQGAHEALLLNTDGYVVEGASSNLFWLHAGAVYTPPLASGVLAGVTRAVVSELCGKLGLPLRESNVTPESLAQADGVFLSLSSLGIVEAVALDGRPLARDALIQRMRGAYLALLRAETGQPAVEKQPPSE